MAGSVNDEMKDFVESWESVTETTNYIIRIDPRGDEKPEAVISSRKFKISTYERMITQDRIIDPKNDPFTNGCFRPLLVPKEVSIETNPNALSNEDIDRVLQASKVAWEEYMKIIDSTSTLRRMVDRAENIENLPLARLRELENRLTELEGPKRITQKDQETYDKMGSEPVGAGAASRGRPRKVVS